MQRAERLSGSVFPPKQRTLLAQFFTHGQDLLFNQGKRPGPCLPLRDGCGGGPQPRSSPLNANPCA